MNNIVCVTSPVGVGCTFLDWSIHFLAGKDKFYSVKNKSWIPLVTNPVTQLNAHSHKRNHTSGYTLSWKFVMQLADVSDNELLSFYPFPLYSNVAQKNINTTTPLTVNPRHQIVQYQQQDYEKLINSLTGANIKVVYLTLDKKNILYLAHKRITNEELLRSTGSDLLTQQGVSADTITNRREKLAIWSTPFDPVVLMEDLAVNVSEQLLKVDALVLWHNGENTIKTIMNFLNLTVDETRWQEWVDVYHMWQQIQLNIMSFVNNFDTIILAILNNVDYNIGQLSFEQEVMIQNYLIHRCNFNLNSDQLEYFPSNAQDLHKLLVPIDRISLPFVY